jgi:hypothetical protein
MSTGGMRRMILFWRSRNSIAVGEWEETMKVLTEYLKFHTRNPPPVVPPRLKSRFLTAKADSE